MFFPKRPEKIIQEWGKPLGQTKAGITPHEWLDSLRPSMEADPCLQLYPIFFNPRNICSDGKAKRTHLQKQASRKQNPPNAEISSVPKTGRLSLLQGYKNTNMLWSEHLPLQPSHSLHKVLLSPHRFKIHHRLFWEQGTKWTILS